MTLSVILYFLVSYDPWVYQLSLSLMEHLEPAENALLGAASALLEGILLQPTLYWKNAAAQNLPFTADPTLIYRGTAAALVNESVQMALQFSVVGQLKEAAPSTPAGELVAAAAGGVVSAAAASPVELIMVQQQRFGGGLLPVARRLLADHGAGASGMMRGLGPAILRDSIYVCGLLGLAPLVQRKLVQRLELPGSTASAYASVLGGVTAGVLSHPFDVIKTCMQGDMARTNYRGFVDSTLKLVRGPQGVRSLLNGCAWRTFNIVATIFVAVECCERLPPFLMRITRPAPDKGAP